MKVLCCAVLCCAEQAIALDFAVSLLCLLMMGMSMAVAECCGAGKEGWKEGASPAAEL